MKCPCCNEEMEKGMIESTREVFYSTKLRKGKFFFHGAGGDVRLTEKNWTYPQREAYRCVKCKYVVIPYEDKDRR